MAHILVIEDDERVGRVLLRTLKQAGHDAAVCGNATDALGRLSADEPDIVITDLFLPDHHGLELIAALRLLYPRIRVIAITGGEGRVDRDLVAAAVRHGAVCGLRKPFGPEALLNALAVALRMEDERDD